MKLDEFDILAESAISDMSTVLVKKSPEYSQGGDRLANFKKMSVVNSLIRNTDTVEAAAFFAMCKQVVGVIDFVNGDLRASTPEGKALLREKFGDVRNYLVLLEGIILEVHADSDSKAPKSTKIKDLSDKKNG